MSKYNDVLTQLELSREFIKNFSTISAEFERLKKKLAKKELQERYVAETGKVRLVLQMQVRLMLDEIIIQIYSVKLLSYKVKL